MHFSSRITRYDDSLHPFSQNTARFLISALSSSVGESSASAVSHAQNSKERLERTGVLIRLRLPPRAPKERFFRISLFCFYTAKYTKPMISPLSRNHRLCANLSSTIFKRTELT